MYMHTLVYNFIYKKKGSRFGCPIVICIISNGYM